jgi:hypothetical protein
VADPWTEDFAALGERSADQLRSLAATRAHVLSSPETTKMRMFKNRPLLATLLVLGLVGAASGAAYAVDRIFLHVDPDKTAPEIERDVKSQLESVGVQADVHAEKTAQNVVQIGIASSDPTLADKLAAEVDGSDGSPKVRVEVHTALDDAQMSRLTQVLAATATATIGDADPSPALRKALADAGFTDVDVTTDDDGTITVAIKSPPH